MCSRVITAQPWYGQQRYGMCNWEMSIAAGRKVASAAVASRKVSLAVSREVASAAVASRTASVAVSREMASVAGRWQVQQWLVGWPVWE